MSCPLCLCLQAHAVFDTASLMSCQVQPTSGSMKPGSLLSLKSPMLAAACATAAMSSGASYVSSGLLALKAAHSAARCFLARRQASARDSRVVVVLLLPALLASGPAGLKGWGDKVWLRTVKHSRTKHTRGACHSRPLSL